MNGFHKLAVIAVWVTALCSPKVMAAAPPTRDQAVAILDDFRSAFKTGDVEKVTGHFHRAPEWSAKQFENKSYFLFEAFAGDVHDAKDDDLSGIESLERTGSWGPAGELLDKDHVRRWTLLHGVKPGDCHALVSNEKPAEVIFHWNGAKLTILHYSDPATKEALREYLDEGMEGIHGSEPTGIAMSFSMLAMLGPNAEAAIPTLSNHLQHDDAEARLRAAITLWKIDRKATVSVPPILEVLADGQLRTGARTMAAECLGSMGPAAKSAAKELRAAMNEGDAKLRATSAWALWKTNRETDATLPVFLDLLSDPKGTYIAEKAIVEMVEAFQADPARRNSRHRLVQQVIDASSSKDLRSRRTAVTILGKIGAREEAVREALEKALQDEDIPVRVGASQALKKLDQVKGAEPNR